MDRSGCERASSLDSIPNVSGPPARSRLAPSSACDDARMTARRNALWGATGVAVGGIVAFGFALPGRGADISPWWSLATFGVLGVLFSLVSRPERWWVGLGFAWLVAAWIEAGQAVWLPDSGRARIEDLVLGCVGGTLGVAAVVGSRALTTHRRTTHAEMVVPPAATAAAAAPPIR